MNYTTITQPTMEPITLNELKQYLRITHDQEDALLTNLIRTAREWLEQETHHILMQQRIRIHISFDLRNPKVRLMNGTTAVLMTVGSVQAVHHVHSIMVDGQKLLLRRDQYQWTQNGKNNLLMTKVEDGVGMDIECTAGYGPGRDDVPSFLRYQVLQCALHFYEHRDLQDMQMFAKMRECLGAHRPRRVA